ncbi:TetR/AcrR family transcriptional regulator C-terminal domain-containing protein [Streptomyces sp. NPDC057307]|uniref:TetR/AcrR family transcriptional regulator C-terminal domain-containing protein n=1 Tax=Streptomyces sp. NPDC057307 TaxID=3346096 RepID=UPI003635FCC4
MKKDPPRPPRPPYLRIVAEIRRRIADGELSPGDPVPSTRQIAREWGVALATATKALTTLRLQGVVLAKPRVGTVVAPAAADSTSVMSTTSAPPVTSAASGLTERAEHGEHGELTRDRVVRAAVEIADAEGLAALSMRGVAARLGVATMSPYRHVTGKDDLVLLMADAVYGEESYPGGLPAHWRPRIELGARTQWALYRRHPWLAHITSLTRPVPLPNLMVHAEWILSALDGHGLAPRTVLDLHVLIYSYVQGIAVNLEREAQAQSATGLSEEEWLNSQGPALDAVAASGDHPTFARITAAAGREGGYDLRLDELFEFGLGPLLDGLTVVIEG